MIPSIMIRRFTHAKSFNNSAGAGKNRCNPVRFYAKMWRSVCHCRLEMCGCYWKRDWGMGYTRLERKIPRRINNTLSDNELPETSIGDHKRYHFRHLLRIEKKTTTKYSKSLKGNLSQKNIWEDSVRAEQWKFRCFVYERFNNGHLPLR